DGRCVGDGANVATLGAPANNARKNAATGKGEDEPVFIDVDAFNRGDFGKKADLVEQYLHKGHQAFIEGHLQLDQWTSQDGQKRQKLKIVLDNLQFLEPRSDSGGRGPSMGRGAPARSAPQYEEGPSADAMDAVDSRGETDIPF